VSGTALGLVLLAALLHAGWNALVKASGDRALVLALIALGHLVLGLAMATQVPLPGWSAAPYILASTVIHWGYYWAIFHAYRLGDLSLVYPISRGAAPLLVALGAVAVAGETLSAMGWAGVLAVSAGVMLLAAGEFRRGVPGPAALIALLIGLIIASYSVVDGTGARLATDSLGYIAWLFICEGIVAGWLFWRCRRQLPGLGAGGWARGLAGGLASALAYGLAIHAKTIAPLGLVSALRETSVVIAALIGMVMLGERPWRLRMVAAVVVACGAAMIALA